MILQVEPVFKLKWVRRETEEFEPFRQKTLRPKLTQAEGFILGVGAKMLTKKACHLASLLNLVRSIFKYILGGGKRGF